MTAQHTPGPWTFYRWDEFNDARFYVAQADGAPYTPNFSDVATLISETVSSERTYIQEANARLIATAPELLAELQLVYERSYNPFEPDNQSEQYKRVGALIAKATGDAQ